MNPVQQRTIDAIETFYGVLSFAGICLSAFLLLLCCYVAWMMKNKLPIVLINKGWIYGSRKGY